MIRLTILLICLLFSEPLSAQSFAIAADKMNMLYEGLDNPLTIAVENINCEDVIVESDSAIIERSDYNACSFNVRAAKAGKIEIKLYRKKGDKKQMIGTSVFRVKKLPDPIARVGGIHSGEINKNVLRPQIGIIANFEGLDIEARIVVKKFSLVILRNNELLFSGQYQEGPKFNEEVKNKFGLLQHDDLVLIYSIFAKTPDGSERQLEPIPLIIKD